MAEKKKTKFTAAQLPEEIVYKLTIKFITEPISTHFTKSVLEFYINGGHFLE